MNKQKFFKIKHFMSTYIIVFAIIIGLSSQLTTCMLNSSNHPSLAKKWTAGAAGVGALAGAPLGPVGAAVGAGIGLVLNEVVYPFHPRENDDTYEVNVKYLLSKATGEQLEKYKKFDKGEIPLTITRHSFRNHAELDFIEKKVDYRLGVVLSRDGDGLSKPVDGSSLEPVQILKDRFKESSLVEELEKSAVISADLLVPSGRFRELLLTVFMRSLDATASVYSKVAQEQIAEKEGILESVRRDLRVMAMAKDQAQANYLRYNANFCQERVERNRLQTEVWQTQEALRGVTAARDQARDARDQSQENYNQARAWLEQERVQHENARAKIRRTKLAKDLVKVTCLSLGEQLQEAREENADSETLLDAYRNRVGNLARRAARTSEENEALSRGLQEVQNHLTGRDQTIAELNQGHQQQTQQLQARLAQTEQQLTQAEREKIETEERNRKDLASLARRRAESPARRAALETLERELCATKEELWKRQVSDALSDVTLRPPSAN